MRGAIELSDCQVQVGDWPDKPGGKIIQFTDNTNGMIITAPLTKEAAEIIAAGLTSHILIPGKRLPLPNNGKQ